MSPAINDPFTAMTCLDHIGDGLAQFIRQGEKKAPVTPTGMAKLRIILEPVTFDALLSAAFDMLRHASCDNASVLLHMLAVIDVIGQETQAPAVRQLLPRHVGLILGESQVGDLIEPARQSIRRRSSLTDELDAVPSTPTSKTFGSADP